MNNRIFELIQQQNGLGLVWSEEDKKCFAELIVRECIDILNSPGAMKVDESTLSEFREYNQGWVNGRKLGIDHLKEHFGIEE